MMGLHELTAHELHELLVSGQTSAREVLDATLARLRAVESEVHSCVLVLDDLAREQADAVDRQLAAGETIGPLAGIPIALKDIFCLQGVETTGCSKILRGFRPPYDATIIARAKAAGLVFIAKTNMDEFAMGSSTENSAFGPSRNPWDLARVPGGSSGGSATAIAANQAALALGSDTGGSVRQPAAFCGIVGLKPTYGRVSRYGLIAFASSLDQIGPITKDVRDCALIMNLIAGHDPADSTSIPAPAPDYTAALTGDLRGLRVGVAEALFVYRGHRVDPEVETSVRAAIGRMAELGAIVHEVSLPHLDYVIPVYYLIAPAEASSNLARYDGVQYGYRTPDPALDIVGMYRKTRDEGFGSEVKRRIMLGTYALSAGYYDAYYLKAGQVRTLVRRDFDNAFAGCDVIVGPTAPSPAFRLGEKVEDPLAMYLSDVGTIPANLAGLPAISLPCGFADGLPVGLQIIGRPLGEEDVLRAAYAFEQSSDFHRRTARPIEEVDGRRRCVARASEDAHD